MEDTAAGRHAQWYTCDRIHPTSCCEGGPTAAKRTGTHAHCWYSGGSVYTPVSARDAAQACCARPGPCVHADEAGVDIDWRVVHPPCIVSLFSSLS